MEKDHIKPTIDVFEWDSDIKYGIYGLLNIYHELSFSELAKKLGKAKSTIHPHLKKLMELGIIEISRKQFVKANIKAYYYSLNQDNLEKMLILGYSNSEKLNKKKLQRLARHRRASCTLSKRILDRFIEFLDLLQDSDQIEGIWPDLFKEDITKWDTGNLFHAVLFLTEDQWARLRKLYANLIINFEKQCIDEWRENPTEEKKFYFFGMGVPLKAIFESDKALKLN